MIWSEAAVQRYSKKRCSENMQQIYRRTPSPKCYFNKVAATLLKSHLDNMHCFNPFSTIAPLMVKPGSGFLVAKCLKNTCRRVTFK